MSAKFTRRNFLKYIGQSIIFAGFGRFFPVFGTTLANAAPALPDGKHYPVDYEKELEVSYLRQIVGSNPADNCTIMWEMPAPNDGVGVEYMNTKKEGAAWVMPSMAESSITDAPSYIYTVHLTEMEADGSYAYRLVRNDAATPWHNIKTAGYGRVDAIIAADSQCGNDYATWQETIHAAGRKFPRVDFIADLGDLTDNGQSYWHWSAWYDAWSDILPDTLFVPVMGNHECYDLNWKNSLPVGYYEQFSLPPNGSRRFGGDFYDFIYGPVHFYVLNTQFAELDGLIPTMKEAQLRWFRETVAKNNRPWQVVLMHKDILSYNEWNPHTESYGGLNDIAYHFMPVFDELDIDLVLTGHMHTYRNRGHISNFLPADKGPVYIMCGRSGNQHYDVPQDEKFDRVVLKQPEPTSYLHLTGDAARLRVECYLIDGNLADTMVLTKRA